VVREQAFRVGDRVSHKTFGEGLVLETLGQGDDQSVVVSFSADRSQRKLMLKFAKLSKVEREEAQADSS
jgi:DNA helicase-2/ATP-dependent DNA helicase PcrA